MRKQKLRMGKDLDTGHSQPVLRATMVTISEPILPPQVATGHYDPLCLEEKKSRVIAA